MARRTAFLLGILAVLAPACRVEVDEVHHGGAGGSGTSGGVPTMTVTSGGRSPASGGTGATTNDASGGSGGLEAVALDPSCPHVPFDIVARRCAPGFGCEKGLVSHTDLPGCCTRNGQCGGLVDGGFVGTFVTRGCHRYDSLRAEPFFEGVPTDPHQGCGYDAGPIRTDAGPTLDATVSADATGATD